MQCLASALSHGAEPRRAEASVVIAPRSATSAWPDGSRYISQTRVFWYVTIIVANICNAGIQRLSAYTARRRVLSGSGPMVPPRSAPSHPTTPHPTPPRPARHGGPLHLTNTFHRNIYTGRPPSRAAFYFQVIGGNGCRRARGPGAGRAGRDQSPAAWDGEVRASLIVQ